MQIPLSLDFPVLQPNSPLWGLIESKPLVASCVTIIDRDKALFQ